jgi:hypothetical protein
MTPQLIGGRYDGMTEAEAGKCVYRVWVDDAGCWLEIFDPVSGIGHRYEQIECNWVWAGYVRERV